MLTKEEARARVAKGAAHLDQVRPGWAQQIDVGRLTMHACDRCIIGQLGQGKYKPCRDFGVPSDEGTEPYGFYVSFNDGGGSIAGVLRAYRLLQDAWIEAICDRLQAVGVEETDGNVATGCRV